MDLYNTNSYQQWAAQVVTVVTEGHITDEAKSRLDADTAEAKSRLNADTLEAKNRSDADIALGVGIDNLSADNSSSVASLTTRVDAIVTKNNSDKLDSLAEIVNRMNAVI